MRPQLRFAPSRSALALAFWLLAGLIGWQTLAWSSDLPVPTLSAPSTTVGPALEDDADSALKQALELERQLKWSEAIKSYEEALRKWPERVDFRHRQRLCESHYWLGRRYQDRSFRNTLLRLNSGKAFELYSEVIERIESHYVEPVAFEPLLRRGLDNLEVALRDHRFLDANVSHPDPKRVLWLRQTCSARRQTVVARNRAEAVAFLHEVCELGRQAIGLQAAPIVLEFTYGACDALDDYTLCLSPDKLDDLYAVIDGNFVGLGVELKADDAGLLLVGVIPGGPAAEAGLKIGERIDMVEGRRIAGLGLDEAASLLQGAEGSALDLEILDPRGQARIVHLVRREVEVRSVSMAKMVDPAGGVGYVRLDGFQKSSTQELQKAIQALQARGMKFLVLDLRGNPGGLLDVAVDIADGFLNDGVIVSTRGRAANQSAVYRAHTGSVWSMPTTVLVDHDSASASEILAGALKDNRRATVIGERTYGKGSVQSIFPLRSAPAGLKLTTAKFYSPLNRSYSEQGVEPDVTVAVRLKPTGPDDLIDPSVYGDPTHDPVLDRAISQAKRQLSVAR